MAGGSPLAGGIDGPEQIELALAAGATRVVVPVWKVAESVDTLRACLRIATDWMAVGVDARPDRLRDYPWHGPLPTLDGLVGMLASEGVRRLVVSHWTMNDLPRLGGLAADLDIELQLAGVASTLNEVLATRDAGADALILGETLFTGAVDYKQAIGLLAGPIPIGVANG